jgi:hypothetical protein
MTLQHGVLKLHKEQMLTHVGMIMGMANSNNVDNIDIARAALSSISDTCNMILKSYGPAKEDTNVEF